MYKGDHMCILFSIIYTYELQFKYIAPINWAMLELLTRLVLYNSN